MSLAMWVSSPENPDSFMLAMAEEKMEQARSLCETGQWSEVLLFARKWQAEAPTAAKPLLYVGLGLTGLAKYREAESAYRQALALDTTDTKVWNNLGGLLFERLQRPRDGILCLEQALKLNPGNRVGWANLAAMVGKLGMHPKAIQYADRALALEPWMIEALLYKGAAARALGQTAMLAEVCRVLAQIPVDRFHRAH